jgi:hypothetical protein
MSTYRVITVDQAGRTPVELVRAQVESITWELNAAGEAVYRLPVLDPQATSAAIMLQREVQIWRDGVLVFWGLPVAYQADLASMTITAFGLLHYFATRYFGPVYSNTMPPALVNGSFQANPASSGWTPSSPAPTLTTSTTHKYVGTQSMRLTGGGNPSALYYIDQIITIPTPARTKPLTVTLSAWVYPENITAYGFEDRGIEIQHNIGLPVPDQEWATLTANVPQNRWTRLETSLVVPANTSGTVTIALFAPAAGSAYYDAVRFTWEQKTGGLEGEDWVDGYLRRIFNLGAGNTLGGSVGSNAWWGASVPKSNIGMNFLPSVYAAGSLTTDVAWNHEDAGNILEAMMEVVKRDKADFEVTWNALGTTRNLTPYVPRKGTVKRALAVELGRNLTKFTYAVDGRQSGNDIRYVGRNSGNTKEVGQAGGPSPATIGGVQFERVEAPPQEVDAQGLIDAAVAEERRLRAPVVVPTLTCRAAGLLDTTNVDGPLRVGDTIPVRMNHGAIQENDLRRVVKMTLRPATEELELVVNVVS